MTKLKISDELQLPLEAITETFAILAMRGAGKSNTAVVIAEQMYANGLPFVTIDPKGDWWGIRSSAEGKGAGLPVPVFGGLHGDVPLEPTGGALVADLIVDKRLTCVLDVSEFSKGEQIRFLVDFGDRLFRRNRDPLHLFLEEADDYIPQRVMREQARCVYVYGKIVKQGRFRGLGCTLITQRSAVLNKDVLSQIGSLIVMRTTAPQDRKAVLAWVEHHAISKEIVDSLPGLENGEAWIWSPHWLRLTKRVHFLRRRTFDSGATPEMGKARPPAKLADIDLAEISQAMAQTIEKAKADDPKELRKRIAELERQLAAKPAAPAKAPAPIVSEIDRKWFAHCADELRIKFAEMRDSNRRTIESQESLAKDLQTVDAGVDRLLAKINNAITDDRTVRSSIAPADKSVLPARERENAERNFNGIAGAGERRVLTAIVQHASQGGCTREQLTALIGYKRSARDTYLSRLRSAGLVEPIGDRFTATAAGIAALGGDVQPLPTGSELRAHWLQRLPDGERKLLAAICVEHPKEVERAALDNLGYKRSARDTYLSRLAARQLITITGPGRVRASDILF